MRGYLIVVDGVVDADIQLPEKPALGNKNIVGFVITIADQGKNSSAVFVSRNSNGLFPWTQENPTRD